MGWWPSIRFVNEPPISPLPIRSGRPVNSFVSVGSTPEKLGDRNCPDWMSVVPATCQPETTLSKRPDAFPRNASSDRWEVWRRGEDQRLTPDGRIIAAFQTAVILILRRRVQVAVQTYFV